MLISDQKQVLSRWLLVVTTGLLAILPLEGTTALRNVLLAVALVMLIALYARKGSSEKFDFLFLRLWLLYTLICAFNLIWAVDLRYSIHEMYQELFFGALCFWIGLNVFCNRDRFNIFFVVLLVSNIVFCGYTIWCLLRGVATKDVYIGTINTGAGNFSTYIVTVLPVLLGLGWVRFRAASNHRLFAYVILISVLNLVALYATQNRQGLVSLAVGSVLVSVILSFRARRPHFLILAMCLLALFAAIFQNHAVTRGTPLAIDKALVADGRLGRWSFVLEQSVHTPWVGAGAGRETFKHLYPQHEMSSGPYVHVHNMLMNRLVQLGFPGVLMFLALFFSPAWYLFRHRNASVIAYSIALTGICVSLSILIKNMTDDFFIRELACFYWVLMGAIIAFQRQATVARNERELV
jgi:O-antigen ligase